MSITSSKGNNAHIPNTMKGQAIVEDKPVQSQKKEVSTIFLTIEVIMCILNQRLRENLLNHSIRSREQRFKLGHCKGRICLCGEFSI